MRSVAAVTLGGWVLPMIVALETTMGLRERGGEELLRRLPGAPLQRCYMSFTPRELLAIAKPPDPVQMCAWCGVLIRHGAIARPSHGCCERCAEQLLAEPDSAEAAP